MNGPDSPLARMVVQRSAPVREQVADRIRDAIVRMELLPGQLLVERELCDATTASRASVREALRQLESDGLVTSLPGRGTRVVALTPEDAMNVYEARSAIEGFAGRLFTLRASDQDRAALVSAVDSIEEVVDDPAAMLEAKAEFYDVLFRGAQNPVLHKLFSTLVMRVTLLRAQSLAVPGRPHETMRELRAILAAVMSGDPAATSDALVAHVEAPSRAALGTADPAA